MLRKPYILLFIVLIPIVLSISSCANYIVAVQMVSAPNDSLLGTTVNNQFELINNATDQLIARNGFQRSKIKLTESGIEISYFDIPAADYGYMFNTKPMLMESGKIQWIHTHWQWKDNSCFVANEYQDQSRIILMLHGWARDNRSLMSYAVEFAQLGFRVIVPDLRGHGKSSGEWLSFGVQESMDISEFADQLQLKRFDVLGFSLGAATALQMASRDKRVNRVIAVAPMHSIEETIPKFGLRSRPWIAYLLEDNEQNIVSSATKLTGFDLTETSNTLVASSKITNPTLLVYGENDQMSDADLNRSIYESLIGDDNALRSMPDLRHTFVLQHQAELTKIVASWMGLETNKSVLEQDICPIHEYTL